MKKYNPEIKAFIAAHVVGRTAIELAELTNQKMGTNFTEGSMKAYKSNHKLKSGTKRGNPPDFSKTFSNEVQAFIRDNAKGKGNAELAKLVNKRFKTQYTKQQVKTYKHNHHISSGLDGRFPPGHVPASKGKKMSPEQYAKSAPTMFKKGNIPPNRRAIGDERRDAKDGFCYVKIVDGNKNKNWKQKHHVLWEQHNGKVPKGHKVVFLDGNRENIVIENLALVSNAELAVINRSRLKSEFAEITKAAITLAKTKCAIRRKRKQQEGGSNV